jgi:uncharacterized membrane protein
MTSGAFAVTISVWTKWLRWPFLVVSLVFVYTTALNIYERPEGIKISAFFIAATVIASLISRAMRSTELRIRSVELNERAAAIWRRMRTG